MSDEEQNAYKKAVIQDIPVDEFIKSVYSYLNYGDFETALKELEDFMEILPFKFREDPQFDYFYFNNPLEEKLFRKYFKTPKEMKVIPFGDEYPRVFYLYGVVLMNLTGLKVHLKKLYPIILFLVRFYLHYLHYMMEIMI